MYLSERRVVWRVGVEDFGLFRSLQEFLIDLRLLSIAAGTQRNSGCVDRCAFLPCWSCGHFEAGKSLCRVCARLCTLVVRPSKQPLRLDQLITFLYMHSCLRAWPPASSSLTGKESSRLVSVRKMISCELHISFVITNSRLLRADVLGNGNPGRSKSSSSTLEQLLFASTFSLHSFLHLPSHILLQCPPLHEQSFLPIPLSVLRIVSILPDCRISYFRSCSARRSRIFRPQRNQSGTLNHARSFPSSCPPPFIERSPTFGISPYLAQSSRRGIPPSGTCNPDLCPYFQSIPQTSSAKTRTGPIFHLRPSLVCARKLLRSTLTTEQISKSETTSSPRTSFYDVFLHCSSSQESRPEER